jgi:hypothetical protein
LATGAIEMLMQKTSQKKHWKITLKLLG